MLAVASVEFRGSCRVYIDDLQMTMSYLSVILDSLGKVTEPSRRKIDGVVKV